MSADINDVRTAIRAILIGDAALLALLEGEARVFYLQVRKSARDKIPTVTYFDTADRPDRNVPFQVRSLTFNIWARNIGEAGDITSRIITLLDKAPVTIPSGDWRVNYVHFVSAVEGLLEEGDIVQKSLEFEYSVYDLTQTV
jgi:hypothetical protein